MRFARFEKNGTEGLGVKTGAVIKGFLATEPGYPGDLA